MSLESVQVLDVTRERTPPHYHIAVYPTPYREYVTKLEAAEQQQMLAAQPSKPIAEPVVTHTTMAALPARRGADLTWIPALAFGATCGLTVLGAMRGRLRR